VKGLTEELLDRPRAVRAGEQLDTDALLAYLRGRLPGVKGPLEVEQFPAGYSNLTYLLRDAAGAEFVLRRPPFGSKVRTAHDMGREYAILTRLRPVYPKVPRALLFCDDESVIGAQFYVMERVRGVVLRARAPEGLALSPEVLRRLSESFVDTLAELHGVDYAAAGLGDLGRPEGYVRRQVEGWTRRYYDAWTEDVQEIETLERWLAANLPSDSGASLIHNDYKYDNIVLDPSDLSRIVAVLDWEMATIGDPLMDLGTTLAYWVEPEDPEEWRQLGFGLTALPGNLTRLELAERYARARGRHEDLGPLVFYYAYGLLKVATIVQQIYYRYRQGHTRDARFAALAPLVKACGSVALRAIERGRIDRLN